MYRPGLAAQSGRHSIRLTHLQVYRLLVLVLKAVILSSIYSVTCNIGASSFIPHTKIGEWTGGPI